MLADADEICDSQEKSQPLSLSLSLESFPQVERTYKINKSVRPPKGTGQCNELRSIEEIGKGLF